MRQVPAHLDREHEPLRRALPPSPAPSARSGAGRRSRSPRSSGTAPHTARATRRKAAGGRPDRASAGSSTRCSRRASLAWPIHSSIARAPDEGDHCAGGRLFARNALRRWRRAAASSSGEGTRHLRAAGRGAPPRRRADALSSPRIRDDDRSGMIRAAVKAGLRVTSTTLMATPSRRIYGQRD